MTRQHQISEGITLFNAHSFWHAHEAWEQLWLHSSGDEKRFLQGLIQLAAAYHHVKRGTLSGAVRLFDASLEKLAPFEDGYLRVRRTEAIAVATRHRERVVQGETIDASEYPKLAFE